MFGAEIPKDCNDIAGATGCVNGWKFVDNPLYSAHKGVTTGRCGADPDAKLVTMSDDNKLIHRNKLLNKSTWD
jgi:hypothetical protein